MSAVALGFVTLFFFTPMQELHAAVDEWYTPYGPYLLYNFVASAPANCSNVARAHAYTHWNRSVGDFTYLYGGCFRCALEPFRTSCQGVNNPTGLTARPPNYSTVFDSGLSGYAPTPAPTVSLSASPTAIALGASSRLSWSSSYALSCIGTNFSTGGNVSGSVVVSPGTTTTYSVTCYGIASLRSASQQVSVTAQRPSVTLQIGSYRSTGTPISWSSSYATSCTGTNFSTGGRTSGSTTVSPTVTTTYRVTCTGPGGSRTESDELSVPSQPISGSCRVLPAAATTGTTVTWEAFPSGGTGSYTYAWSGTDGLSGSSKVVRKSYGTAGTKTGSVRVTSGSQSHTIACYNAASITPSCTPQHICSGGHVVNSCTSARVDTCSHGCSSGQCNPVPQCSDGIDNDGDGRIDLADYGCTGGAGDTSESPNPQCSDGIDNDGDGRVDLADSGCSDALDNNEYTPPVDAVLDFIVTPNLVRTGTVVAVSWSATDVYSCTVVSSHGDTWTGTSGSESSSPIMTETTFVLACEETDGDSVSTAAVVKLVPIFEEVFRSLPTSIAHIFQVRHYE